MKCPCCGSQEISELKEVGGPTKHICKTCGARVPQAGDRVMRCPKCKELYYQVEDFGDVTCFVHRKVRNENGQLTAHGCVIPTVALKAFVSGAVLLTEGRA